MNSRRNFALAVDAFVSHVEADENLKAVDGGKDISNARMTNKARLTCANLLRAFIERAGPLWDQACELVPAARLAPMLYYASTGSGLGFSDIEDLEFAEPCATVYGRERWSGRMYSLDGESLGRALDELAYGTSRVISEFAYLEFEIYRGWIGIFAKPEYLLDSPSQCLTHVHNESEERFRFKSWDNVHYIGPTGRGRAAYMPAWSSSGPWALYVNGDATNTAQNLNDVDAYFEARGMRRDRKAL